MQDFVIFPWLTYPKILVLLVENNLDKILSTGSEV